MTRKTTQTEMVLDLLRDRGEEGLTPLDALVLIGTFRLGARIWDAKRLLGPGERIITERASSGDKSFARYVLRRLVSVGQQVTIWP